LIYLIIKVILKLKALWYFRPGAHKFLHYSAITKLIGIITLEIDETRLQTFCGNAGFGKR